MKGAPRGPGQARREGWIYGRIAETKYLRDVSRPGIRVAPKNPNAGRELQDRGREISLDLAGQDDLDVEFAPLADISLDLQLDGRDFGRAVELVHGEL